MFTYKLIQHFQMSRSFKNLLNFCSLFLWKTCRYTSAPQIRLGIQCGCLIVMIMSCGVGHDN